MKRKLLVLFCLVGFVACGNSSTGSTTFVADEFRIGGNPSIIGEGAGTLANPSGYLSVGGLIDSALNLELTGVAVQIRILGENNTVLGAGVVDGSPTTVAPLGSSSFETRLFIENASYTASRIVEITPLCDQGTGTVRSISLQWPGE